MMKKLFTLLTLLVAIVTGAWAADEVVTIGSHSSGAFTISGTSHDVAGYSSGTNTATITPASDGQTASAGSKMNVTTNIGSKLSGKAHIRFTVSAGETVRLYIYWGSNSKSATFRTSDYTQSNNYYHEGIEVSSATKNTLQFVDFTFADAGTYAISAVSGDNPYMAAIKFTAAVPAGPSITDQTIADANYMQGQTTGVAALSVTAQASDDNNSLEYQWYSNTTNSTEGGTAIATGTSYTPNVSAKGVTYYYCVVTEKDGDSQVVGDPVASNIAKITVSEAEAPTIQVSGAPSGDVKVGTVVTLTASATGTPTPTITWYNGNDESVATAEATELSYTVPTTTAGTYTFYAIADNQVGTPATTETLAIVVKEQVAKPTISPATAMFTDGSTEVTIECTTTGATIKYSTDGGTTWADYSSALTIDATTTLIAKAVKDGYLDSETATGSYTKIDYTMTPLVPVSTATTWDWSGMSTTVQLKDDGTTIPPKGHTFDVNAADFDGTILPGNAQWPSTFAASSLAFTQSEYPVRGTYYQGYTVKFQAAVPGIVKVYYSNTSTKEVARYANINGTNYGAGSKNSTLIWTEEVPVEAGMVTITGMEGESTPNYIHIQKIVFTPRPASIDLTINAAAGATTVYSDYALDFSTLTNVKAYIEKGTGDKLSWTQVTSAPAKTGLLVVSSETALTVPTAASSETDVTGNRLKGVATGESKNVTDGDNIYIFTLHDGKPGFIKSNTGRSLAVGKAYLDLGEATGAREFFDLFEDGTTTGISSIDNDQLTTDNDAPAYNLAGQKVGKGYKGIVIINGKKVVK